MGKSALVEALAEGLARYEVVAEPYALLEEDGYAFAHPPSLEDFVAQLERSLEELESSGANTIFDRAPLDLLGYLQTHPDAEGFDVEAWLPRVRAAVEQLDLIVFVAIEEPDRIAIASGDADDSRGEVDAALREIVVDDAFGLELETVVVSGPLRARVKQVLARVRG